MNGLLKKALTVMLATTMLTSTIPAGTVTTVVAEDYNVTNVYDGSWEEELNGTGTATGEYTVASASDWETLVADANTNEKNFDGETIVLTGNIAFTDGNTILQNFAGTLDGNGFTITGATNPLIFKMLGGSVVKNLKIDGSVISTSTEANVGVLSNQANLTESITVSNVVVTNADVTNSYRRASGLICCVDGNKVGKTLTLENCSVSGEIKASKGNSDHDSVGGLVARTNISATGATTVKLRNCKNSANITVTGTGTGINYDVGGIIGYNFNSNIDAENCLNTGNVTKTGTSKNLEMGGIVGLSSDKTGDDYANGAVKMTNCTNAGTISGTTATDSKNVSVGGLFSCASISITLNNCHNTGDLTSAATGTYGQLAVGGLCSYTGEIPFTATGCTNSGSIKSEDDFAGGIAGRPRGNVTITECVNTGAVQAKTRAGGLVVGLTPSYILLAPIPIVIKKKNYK